MKKYAGYSAIGFSYGRGHRLLTDISFFALSKSAAAFVSDRQSYCYRLFLGLSCFHFLADVVGNGFSRAASDQRHENSPCSRKKIVSN
jgi:hypothetical protein